MFLFKQKTAYEMRISDWSSDVCASDLGESELMDKEEAYKIIEYHYRNNFKNLISRYSRQFQSHSRAEDIVQEAYTRALQYWNRYSARKRVVSGKSVSVRVDLGGRRIITNKTNTYLSQ